MTQHSEPRATDEKLSSVVDYAAKQEYTHVNCTPSVLEDFHWEYTEEPHATRRRQILAVHPEIKKLFGPCPLTKYVSTALVLLQLGLAYYLKDQPVFSWKYFLILYLVGATANHWLLLAIHEITHNLAFKSIMANRLFAMFANIPIGLPYSVAFKGYHAEHHKFQGVHAIDTDVPTKFEAECIKGPVAKLLFCFFQIFFYALRPMFVRAQRITIWHAVNWVVQFSVIGCIYKVWGFSPLLYLLLSTFTAGSLHPMAGHFIAEHYVFYKGFETYSYYGPLNIFAFNVGYHNEHHDFPYIPGSRLPQVRKLAPEFYDNLPTVKSWPGTIFEYITNPKLSAYSRIKRMGKSKVSEE